MVVGHYTITVIITHINNTYFIKVFIGISKIASKRFSLDLLQNSPDVDNSKPRTRKQSSKNTHNAVYLMTEFALELMKTLQAFNKDNWQDNNNQTTDSSECQKEVPGLLRIGKN